MILFSYLLSHEEDGQFEHKVQPILTQFGHKKIIQNRIVFAKNVDLWWSLKGMLALGIQLATLRSELVGQI